MIIKASLPGVTVCEFVLLHTVLLKLLSLLSVVSMVHHHAFWVDTLKPIGKDESTYMHVCETLYNYQLNPRPALLVDESSDIFF